MNKTELQAFEYAVNVFNGIFNRDNQNYKFKIVWDTKFGPAYAENIIYDNERMPFIELSFDNDSGEYNSKKIEIRDYQKDLFAFVRHNVFQYFKDSFDDSYSEKLKIVEHPYYLMNKLIALSKIEPDAELNKPNYSSVWNFKTLDGLIKLPFINDDSLIKSPISLIKVTTVEK